MGRTDGLIISRRENSRTRAKFTIGSTVVEMNVLGRTEHQVQVRNRIRFKKENDDGDERKNLSSGIERSWLALERWQGLCRRGLLPQRAYGSGSRSDGRGL